MAMMIRAAAAVFFLILPALSSLGQPLSSLPGQGSHSRVRLLSGGERDGRWLAGIEITLADGFKTYWRNPGESGLPPRFDWSGSENVAGTELLWPAPSRQEDAAGVAYVYHDRVILPVLVKAAKPGQPAQLALSIDYGICKEICIPAHEELSAILSGEGPDRAAIEQALQAVPRPQPLGAQAELSILSATPLTQDKPGLTVTVRAPSGTKPELFAEGPENWYVSASPPDADNRFIVTIDEKPKDASGPVPLRLTLVAGDKAIETEISLDGGQQPR